MMFIRQHLATLALMILLVTAFAVGGGGSRFGLANLVVQLTALACLAACPQGVGRFATQAPILLRALVLASLLVPLIQLVPLPEGLWSTLPGRELVSRSLELAEIDAAMPLSLYPLRTALAATALITPLAVLAIGWTVPRHHLFNLAWLIVLMGIVTVVLGALQLSDTAGRLEFWPEGISMGVLLGTFANRNSTGLFLVGALAFALFLPAPRMHKAMILVRIAVAAMLLTAIILTQSRTALVLSALPLLLALMQLAVHLPQLAGTRSPRRAALIGAAVLALGLAGLGTAVATAPGRLADTLERFEGSDGDTRRFIWEDAIYSAQRYWPVGAGIGAFDDVFQVDEALENIASGRRAARAHNDYLEIAIEAGAAGLALIAAWLAYLAWATWQARRSPDRWAAWGASSFLFAIALQSITDYPLRNQTMLAVAAIALLLLLRIAHGRKERRA